MQRFSTAFRRNDGRYFRTKNLHLAAILLAQGFRLVAVDTEDPGNCEFVLRKTQELEQMVERFQSKLPIFVDARRFIYYWKFLRERVKRTNSRDHDRGF